MTRLFQGKCYYGTYFSSYCSYDLNISYLLAVVEDHSLCYFILTFVYTYGSQLLGYLVGFKQVYQNNIDAC